jgi:two-component system sensor kinase FixL
LIVGILVAIVMASALLSNVQSFRWVSIAAVIASAGLLGWLFIRFTRDAALRQLGSEALRHLNESLEAQVDARTADVRDANARLRSIIDSAVDGIIVIDEQGTIESFNPGAERLFGYPQAEVVGRNVNVLMPSPYHEEHDGYLHRYATIGIAKIIGVGREVSGRRRDGSVFPLHLSVGELMVAGERKFTGILHDLTARVGIERQLRERAALARLGEMAAVIAHEVKNPLAGVRGAIQVFRGRLPADSRDAPILDEIVTRLDALDDLMKDLLLFARPPQPRRTAVDIGPLVALTAELIGHDPSLRGVQVEISGSAPPIAADAEMLKIVFQNLLANGAQAVQGRGRIRVRIRAADGVCHIAFADDGPGIPEELRDRIFTPFFTTKSRGSGLGLATAKRFVEAHHGEIRVECPNGGGTTVTICLPAQLDEVSRTAAADPPTQSPVG